MKYSSAHTSQHDSAVPPQKHGHSRSAPSRANAEARRDVGHAGLAGQDQSLRPFRGPLFGRRLSRLSGCFPGCFSSRAFSHVFSLSFSLLLLLAMASALTAPLAFANPVKADHVQVSLVSATTSAAPGTPLELGVHFELEQGWHVYWQNPGDSGQAPTLNWTLPEGFQAAEPAWPAPHRFTLGPLVNFGYERELLLPVDVAVPESVQGIGEGDSVPLEVRVSWLVCRENCIPGQATLRLELPLRSTDPHPNDTLASVFSDAKQQAPKPVESRIVDTGSTLVLDLPLTEIGIAPESAHVSVFPVDQLALNHSAEIQTEFHASGLSLQLEREETRDEPLTQLAGVVVVEGDGQRKAYAFDAPIESPRSTATAAATASTQTATESGDQKPPGPQHPSLWIALALAFAGGILLNLMPCVFPVLSLKVMGFVEHAHDPGEARRQGWAYTAGVMVSFWALAGLLLAVRAGSSHLGWGFQLQSPGFVAILALLVFVLGLNLLGTFEVGLTLTRLGGVGASRNGLSGSFVTGVLATVVATPCTAPFMGSALGYALTQPAAVALLVFSALGLGMASPYVGLSYFPALLRRLPRPGSWMEVVRQAMAFPLFATVIWLLAVFGQLTQPLAVFKLLAGMLVIGLGVWVYGRYQMSARRPLAALLTAAAVLVGGSYITTNAARSAAVPSAQASPTEPGDLAWEPWSKERVDELRAAGRPVFVNFTAAWCISCKANEVMVFNNNDVQEGFEAGQVATLKADWTNRNETIAKELEAHGRAGVPLYLYYAPGAEQPETLSSVLTPGLVLDALATAGAAPPN